MRIRLDIAYDGTGFRGWAKQPGLRTVQGVLETGLARIVGSEAHLIVAGRTDAGVHASGQVAHVDLDEVQWSRVTARHGQAASDPAGSLARRIRGVLGQYPDVTVSRTSLAPDGFDARFSAVSRRYSYRLLDHPAAADPTRRRDTVVVRGPLDVGTMDDAARKLLGLQDFAAFCRFREGATTIRDLQRLSWERTGDLVTAHVTADAFCWNMVRSLVGALLAIGEGRREPAWIAGLLGADRRSSEFAAAPARGLTLVGVDYPPDDQLAARIAVTRDLRTL